MVIDDRVRDAYQKNRQLVETSNKSGARFDFVLYGDSITERIPEKTWTTFFGTQSVPLGIGGTTVEELAWRVMVGGERLSKSPRVVGVLIGINNLKWGVRRVPLDRLELLLQWMKAAMPDSNLVLLALLPNSVANVRPVNQQYESLARKLGITYLDCTRTMDPNDTNMLGDGTHPAAKGYAHLLSCLATTVRGMLG